jgi:hypothetical protein
MNATQNMSMRRTYGEGGLVEGMFQVGVLSLRWR